MGFAALIGMGLSGVGVFLIWRTWESTQEATENSRKTLNSYVHRERAILRLEDAHFRFDEGCPTPNGFIVQVRNFGASPADFFSVSWEYLNGPIWPRGELRNEIWPDNIVTPERPATTPHLGARHLTEDRSVWLAVKLIYRTLGDQQYETFRGYKIAYTRLNAHNEGGWSATAQRLSSQPAHT